MRNKERFNCWFTPRLKAKLKVLADKNECTMTQVLVQLVNKAYKEEIEND